MSEDSYLNEFISFADKLADKSAEIIMQYFRHRFNIETKEDNTPVTIADKNAEIKIRDLINKTYPRHGILGEEFEDNIQTHDICEITGLGGTCGV